MKWHWSWDLYGWNNQYHFQIVRNFRFPDNLKVTLPFRSEVPYAFMKAEIRLRVFLIRLRENKFRLHLIFFRLALISFLPGAYFIFALGEILPIVEEEFQILLQLSKILLQLLAY